ncbi:MAG: hypothetical protein ABI868_08965 [Acidobacteriota bacterium]
MIRPHPVFRSAAIAGVMLALAGTAWANGEEFFAPAKNGKVDLVYFGRIKDSQTGRSVTDSVYFVLTDKSTGLSFPFTNDKPGHFRSPDVGTAIKEIGEQIDVKGFVVDINVAGYKKATITRMPRKGEGAVELDVRLEPVVSADVMAAGLNGAGAWSYSSWAAIVLVGLLVLMVIVRGARTSGRPPTTAR